MGERFSGDGAPANGFGRCHLHEWEAHLLHGANYPVPLDMRVLGRWRLSAGGISIHPQPIEAVSFHAEIDCIRASLPEEERDLPEYAASNRAH